MLKNSPRDNVLFELGLFMGALGREHTFIVHCHDEQLDLPSDLAGVAVERFGRRRDSDRQLCNRIGMNRRTIDQREFGGPFVEG